jgi:hypothetical protein
VKCQQEKEEWMSIAEMELFEQNLPKHIQCNALFERVFRPKRHVTFHEDLYENIAHDPIHISSAQQLQDECRKNDVSSNYMKDMSSLFGAKENRWV